MTDEEFHKWLHEQEAKAGKVWVRPNIRRACDRAVATKRRTGVWAKKPPEPKPKKKPKGARYWKRWSRKMTEVRRAT